MSKITLFNKKTKETRTFRSRESAGNFLERIKWPPGLLYAPPADRVALADRLAGSPWKVTGKEPF